MNKKKIMALMMAGVMMFSVTACGGSDTSSEAPASEPSIEEQLPDATDTQIACIKSASNYLDDGNGGFSKGGLRDQLQYEEFTKEDIDYALANMEVDWNQQALANATSYLDDGFGGFSDKSLREQLRSEKFEKSQIDYALKNVEVDWNQQATASAESYMSDGSMSEGELKEQLAFEGFTSEQINYALKNYNK